MLPGALSCPAPGRLWTGRWLRHPIADALGYLGKDIAPGVIEHARQIEVKLPPQLDDPTAGLTPQLIVEVIREVAFHYFPRLAPAIATSMHSLPNRQVKRRQASQGGSARRSRAYSAVYSSPQRVLLHI
jgi:hypothetical protein